MKKYKLIDKISEKLSLTTPAKSQDNGVLSQNLQAVMPNGLNWLFLRPNTAPHGIGAGVNPPYLSHHTAQSGLVCFPLMVWLILQNKPFGEYVKRFLVRPRVRPHHPNTGFSTQNLQGAFSC